MNFVKNQLSSSLIGLSPLITSHLNLLQQVRVQSSTPFYRRFNLLIISSLDFGFDIYNYQNLHFRIHYAYIFLFKLAIYIFLLTHYAKGTPKYILTAISRIKFYDLFTPFYRCFSTFPYGTFYYRSFIIFKLRKWSSFLQTDLRAPSYTYIVLVGVLPMTDFLSLYLILYRLISISLTTTLKISFLFFCLLLLRCFTSQSFTPIRCSGFPPETSPFWNHFN